MLNSTACGLPLVMMARYHGYLRAASYNRCEGLQIVYSNLLAVYTLE